MFPLAHTYISIQVVGRKSPLLVFGGVLPDLTHVTGGRIDRKKLHDSPQEFSSFIQSRFPKLADLALGVSLHSPTDQGADYYSDDPKVGFAKVVGQKIMTETASLWQITEPETVLNFAHNFIEASVDIHLAQEHQGILLAYGQSLARVDHLEVSKALAAYLNLQVDALQKDLRMFTEMFSPGHLASPQALAEKVIISWREKLFGIKANLSATLQILSKASDLTQKDYLNWLDEAVKKMKVDFAALI